jgi:hypothetical protein
MEKTVNDIDGMYRRQYDKTSNIRQRDNKKESFFCMEFIVAPPCNSDKSKKREKFMFFNSETLLRFQPQQNKNMKWHESDTIVLSVYNSASIGKNVLGLSIHKNVDLLYKKWIFINYLN